MRTPLDLFGHLVTGWLLRCGKTRALDLSHGHFHGLNIHMSQHVFEITDVWQLHRGETNLMLQIKLYLRSNLLLIHDAGNFFLKFFAEINLKSEDVLRDMIRLQKPGNSRSCDSSGRLFATFWGKFEVTTSMIEPLLVFAPNHCVCRVWSRSCCPRPRQDQCFPKRRRFSDSSSNLCPTPSKVLERC